MMVGDDDVDAEIPGPADEVVGLDAAIDADHEAGALLRGHGDMLGLEPVAVLEALRDEMIDGRAELRERPVEHDHGQDPVGVVIPEDEDAFAGLDRIREIMDMQTEDEAEYELPSIELLLESEPVAFDAQEQDVRRKAKILEKTFADFGFNVRVVEIHEPDIVATEPARCALLGPALQVLAEPQVTCYRKGAFGDVLGCGFLRGDADSSGAVNITDGVFVLLALFQGGPATKCPDAADVNDDGKVDISDPVRLLGFLFLGSERPPDPFTGCGVDSTGDELDCKTFSNCP